MKKLVAIGVIWLGCAIAWMVLGSTLVQRSGETSTQLLEEVHSLWGPPMQQLPPHGLYHEPIRHREQVTTRDAEGKESTREVVKEEDGTIDVPLVESDLAVRFALRDRQKGLLWFPTYDLGFTARYVFSNPTAVERRVTLSFPLASEHAIYDGFAVLSAEGLPVGATIEKGVAEWSETFKPGERRTYHVAYRSRGTARWEYQLTAGTGQVRQFHLTMDTDFANVNFPPGTLSPSSKRRADGRWHGEWTFASLVANAPIGLELPQKLNPGPLASRITFFAPVGLLFFFFVIAVVATAQRRPIHPLNYFFFGCSFFAFHLLFAYLVDHLAVLPSFLLASAVSLLLLVSYARLLVGWRFAVREMGGAQLLYLVLFSFTFFWTGFTGLSITVGAILTLFVMMQFTGRIDWGTLHDRAP